MPRVAAPPHGSWAGIDPADADRVLARLAFVFVVVVGASAGASRAIEVNATCAADVPHGPAHTRSVRDELTRALAGVPAARGYTLDVSLVRLETKEHAAELEVRAEIRGLVSDARGRIHLSSSASALTRGRARHRERLQRDAVTEAARQLGMRLRAQWPRSNRAARRK